MLSRHNPSDMLAIERAAAWHGLHLVDPFEPPLLPAGARVVVLDEDGKLARDWQWADAVNWSTALAFDTIEGAPSLGRCEACGLITVDLNDSFEAKLNICAGCWEHGDCELDGDNADAAVDAEAEA